MKFYFILISFLLAFNINETPKINVYLIGDSTMSNKRPQDFPETGWGQVFGENFSSTIDIHNHAVNGRSTKSFRDQGLWKTVHDQLQPGDYVFIQFGHNDSKTTDSLRYAPAMTDYKTNLIRYIAEIRAKKAIPLLLTPVSRRKFHEGKAIETHGDYPKAVKEVAAAYAVDVIDMDSKSRATINAQGEELSKLMFMHHGPGIFPKFPKGIEDNTHFSPFGARTIAALVCEGLLEISHPLRVYFKSSPHEGKYTYELPKIAEGYFKPDTFNVIKYGAVPSAVKLSTAAIQSAIDNASQTGGGVVLIPKGMYISGPLVLNDNVNLHLEEGALLQFSDNRADYPIVETTWEGQVAYRCQAPISAVGKSNIALTGKGTLDGSGQVWKQVKRSKLTSAEWKKLTESGGVNDGNTWFPSESARLGENSDWAKKMTDGKTLKDYETVRDFLRPNMISFNRCNLVKIEGLTIKNSPAWTIHPLLCHHTIVKDVSVINPWFGQNNDAIDIESCQSGILEGCYFDSGDDAITIKSGRDAEGRKRGVPTSDWIIKDTKVMHGHGGFVIGSEMSGGVKNLYVNNCTFMGTDIGLRFKTTRGRGGVVDNIHISDIQMSEIVGEAILFNMYYAAKDPVKLPGEEEKPIEYIAEPFTEATPVFKNFSMERIYCKGALEAIKIEGLPESNLSGFKLKDASFVSQKSISINEADQIQLTNVEIKHKEGPVFIINNGKNISFKNVNFLNTSSEAKIYGSGTKNIKLENTNVRKSMIFIDKSTKSKEVSAK